MPELTTADVDAYTGGRLEAGEPETQRLLDSALTAIRRYCGWHVTPVIEEDVVTLDGPGSDLLILPTLRLIELVEIVEDGTTYDLDEIHASARGLVRKEYGEWWTTDYGGIEVTMTHGFESAPDWQSVVLAYVDRTSMAIVSGGQRETVGPFTFGATTLEECSAFTDAEQAILNLYRLEPSP